jgi:cysteine desulfurase
VLVSIIHANNEVGTIQPIAAIAKIAHEAGTLLHTDAAQSAGKIELDVADLGADLVTLAAHKLYGPKGIGALYVRRGIPLDPLVHGGGQEYGRRSGTENVASIVGFGEAARIAREALPSEEARLQHLRDTLHRSLAELLPGIQLNGHPTLRLPNTLNVSLPQLDGSAVLAATPRVAASTGSACHAGTTEPSSVLTAMGFSRERALGAIRLSLGRWTTLDQVDEASRLLTETVRSLTAVASGRESV